MGTVEPIEPPRDVQGPKPVNIEAEDNGLVVIHYVPAESLQQHDYVYVDVGKDEKVIPSGRRTRITWRPRCGSHTVSLL